MAKENPEQYSTSTGSTVRGFTYPIPGIKATAYPLRRQPGFTMVELVTAIMIAGILVFMVAPRFFDRNVFESRGFHDQVIFTLRYAQKAAIAQNRFVCVAFTANSVTLTSGTDSLCTTNSGGSTNLTGPTGTAPYSVSSNNASFLGGAPAAFNFDAQGRPNPNAKQTVNIIDVTNPIIVEAETGYVH